MDEERKKEVAVFRFGVISDFVSPARLEWGERERLLQEKSARQWQIPFSGPQLSFPHDDSVVGAGLRERGPAG